jgi:endo-alpha-1,4-polygalactosaminidase (GH114 family)
LIGDYAKSIDLTRAKRPPSSPAKRRLRGRFGGDASPDLFYGENAAGVRNSASSIRESVRRLKMLTAEGKPVFVVEYPRNDEQAKSARREISDNKFIGLMAKRALDQL